MDNFQINTEESKKILSTLTILYVEDEKNIRENLCATLEIIFNKVIAVANADEALKVYEKENPHMILSDIQMPGMSGIDFVKIIRKSDYKIPIILITAHIETELLLEAAKLKLVDYLQKPVVFETLYQALINATNDIIRNGGLFINFKNGSKYDLHSSLLLNNNKEIKLTSSEQKLLKVFLRGSGKTVSYTEIKEYVWEDAYEATDSALKSLLNKLRGKIGKDSIKNVSGVGYYLVTEQ